jgi:hypothetical protein
MNDCGGNLESGGSVDPPCPTNETAREERFRAAPIAPPLERTRLTPRKTVLNYWVDLGLFVIFLGHAFVVGVTQFVFPNGPIAYEYRLWGLDYSTWRQVQFGFFSAFTLGLLLHLMLHWNWLCCVTNTHVRNRPPGRDDGGRTLWGVGLLVAILHLLAIGLLWAAWAIESP